MVPSKLHNFEENYVNYLNLTIQLSSPVKNTDIQIQLHSFLSTRNRVTHATHKYDDKITVKQTPTTRFSHLKVMKCIDFLLVQKNTKHITFLLNQIKSLKSGEEKV